MTLARLVKTRFRPSTSTATFSGSGLMPLAPPAWLRPRDTCPSDYPALHGAKRKVPPTAFLGSSSRTERFAPELRHPWAPEGRHILGCLCAAEGRHHELE